MGATYGILGWPVEHSRSPAMHNAAFQARGLDACYVHFPVHPDDIAEAVRGLRALGVRGANVTVPHKESVIPHLDGLSDGAKAMGAVNTIVRDVDRLVGHNTDAEGLARSLDEAGVELPDTNVVVLGAGGAARASVVGLSGRKAARVTIAARRLEQAQALAESVRSHVGDCELQTCKLTTETLVDPFRQADLVVQSSSATLSGSTTAEAFAALLPLDCLPRKAVVVDLVYKPLVTSVLARSDQLGLRTVGGLGMLLHQGALAFELWTHTAAPLEIMRGCLQSE